MKKFLLILLFLLLPFAALTKPALAYYSFSGWSDGGTVYYLAEREMTITGNTGNLFCGTILPDHTDIDYSKDTLQFEVFTDGLWQTYDQGGSGTVDLSGDPESHTISLDCEHGTAKIDGVVVRTFNPGLYSSIIIAKPGASVTYDVTCNGEACTELNTEETYVRFFPSTITATVGVPFSVSLVVDSSEATFNAAQANINVSSNLSLTNILPAGTSSCNLAYTKTPTTSDPSFAGAVYHNSATLCRVYKMVVTPTQVGTGTLSISNASVKAFSDSHELEPLTINGSITINPSSTPVVTPTPTPTPNETNVALNKSVTVDSTYGTNIAANAVDGLLDNAHRWLSTDTVAPHWVEIDLNGTYTISHATVYTGYLNGSTTTDPVPNFVLQSWNGTSWVNIPGATASSNTNVALALTFSSPVTTAKVRFYSTSNGYNRVRDISVFGYLSQTPTPTPTPLISVISPLHTYLESYTLFGQKDSSIVQVLLNNSESNTTYPTSISWQIPLTLALGEHTYSLEGVDGSNVHTSPLSVTVNRHTLGDINGDGHIDIVDASLFAVDWGKSSNLTHLLSDMNNDGHVDLTDLSILAKVQEPLS